MPDYPAEFTAIAAAYEASGGDPSTLFDKRFAAMVVSQNRVLYSNGVPGLRMESEEIPTGVKAKITVEPGAVIRNPVHLCFGVLPKEGLQEIISEFHIGGQAKVKFVAHCSFPNAERVRHLMNARIRVGRGAEMDYSETHYHGPYGGVEVLPVARVVVEEGGTYRSQFKLLEGAAGVVKLDYLAEIGKEAVCELDARIYGKKHDRVVINESLWLNGEGARGLAKSRVVASDHCVSEVVGEAVGNAPNARGHIDCVEILKGPDARASAVPKLTVIDERAKLTHEAAIGSVDKRQVETLMARGLSEEEAVDAVVKGMLR
jgi:Fe-S cluster assembly scaffold protein SufB